MITYLFVCLFICLFIFHPNHFFVFIIVDNVDEQKEKMTLLLEFVQLFDDKERQQIVAESLARELFEDGSFLQVLFFNFFI